MKTKTFRTIAMLGVFVAFGATSVLAQSSPRVTANIPFSFSVANHTMPAGKYSVERPGASRDLLLIRSRENNAVTFVMTQGATAKTYSDKTKLVFHRYGNEYFLAKMWTKGESSGTAFPLTRAERQIIKRLPGRNLAKQDIEPEMITIVVD